METQRKSGATGTTRRRRIGQALLGVVAVLLAQLGLITSASAATVEVGPVDPATGFPAWVAAGSDRLDLCLDDPNCLGTTAGLVGPGGEAFWFQAAATLTGQVSGAVEMASEAAFAAAGTGQEIGFNRIRIRLTVPDAGTYRVDYPYGSKTYTLTGTNRVINDTQDVGCVTPPCGDFVELTDSGDGGVGGSFLRWDPAVLPTAPTGFLGDAVTEHRVVGSPIGRNHVSVVRVTTEAGTTTETEVGRTDLFTVQGKVARPRVIATPVAGSYRAGFTARLAGTEPGAVIWYTTDGSEPATPGGALGSTAQVYSSTTGIPVTADVTIKAVNARAGLAVPDPVTGQPAASTSIRYVIDGTAPTLEATPPSGTYDSAQLVSLTATDAKDPAPRIFYTIAQVPPGGADPADPTDQSTRYTGKIPVNGNLDEATTVVKAIAYDAAGNASAVERRAYTINAPDVTASPASGSFATAVDVRLTATDPAAKIYYSTDGQDPVIQQDPVTMQVTGVDHGQLYTNDPIRLTDYTTLKFLAASTAGQSTVKTEDYLIDIPANRTGGNLASVGPVDGSNGYPFWYGDAGDAEGGLAPQRLELCLDDPLCPVRGDLPDPGQPLSFPDNFPDEAFWWSGEAAMDLPGGGTALLVLAQEAAFATNVAPGDQIAFARLRIRLDDVTPNRAYTVTTPYGVDVVTADDRGRARMTEDIGCLTPTCTSWEAPLDGRVGPFLRWDPAVAPAAPAGYVGNPLVEHPVVGSPHGTNFFRVEGPGVGANGGTHAETDLFTVQGKIAQLRASASPGTGLYSTAQTVRITASFPTEAKIIWTTDGSAPQVDDAGNPVGTTRQFVPDGTTANPSAQVQVGEGETRLRFMAVDLADPSVRSQLYEEVYRIEGALPTVSASPDPTGRTFEGAQQVTLSSTVPDIFYTTDNTKPALTPAGDPIGSTRAYTGAFTVGRVTTVKAVAVSALGTVGPVSTFSYDILNLKAVGPPSAANGFPTWYQDLGTATQPPTKLELCVEDPLCPVVGALPNPGQPVSFPGNFPDESFWWAGDAAFNAGATRARLTLGAEAAFGGGVAKANDQVSFSRIRVRANALVAGATYRVTHPYGVVDLVAGADGSIFYTDDTGCLTAPCDFTKMLRGPIGPFLRWDTGAPAGYLGDGATPHAVTGSPYGTNLFRMERITDGSGTALAAPVPLGETNQFVVQGKLAELRVVATPASGTYTSAQQVRLSASEPGATIRYTLDGTAVTATSPLYSGPITIAAQGETVLRFQAFGSDGSVSAPEVERYFIDSIAPDVASSLAAGTYGTAQSVTLSSTDPTAVIHYTTDNSTPNADSPTYTGPITVAQTLTLKAVAIDPVGNQSAVGSWAYTIGQATSTLSLATPSPATIDLNEATTLSGRLLSNGAAVASAPLTLQSRAVNQTVWQQVAGVAATTGADGRFTITGVRPTATTDYRVVYGGGTNIQGSTSAAQRVSVRALLTMNALNSVARGRNVTISGALNPAHPGTQVTVRFTLAGQRSPAAVTANVAANGTWSVTTRAPNRQGTWTVTATWAGDADHLGDTATRTLTVTR